MPSLLRRLARPLARPALDRYADVRDHLAQVDDHITDLSSHIAQMGDYVADLNRQLAVVRGQLDDLQHPNGHPVAAPTSTRVARPVTAPTGSASSASSTPPSSTLRATPGARVPPPLPRLAYNKICNVEDFANPDLVSTLHDVFGHERQRLGPEFPTGFEHRKYWEIGMSVRALRDAGAVRPEAELLGIGAGHEATVFYLTNHVRRVFATDLYLDPGIWNQWAIPSMLTDPVQNWPFGWNPRRLVAQHMDALDLQYEDETFDGIFSASSIEHFGDHAAIRRAMAEAYRVLRPGGILALSSEYRLAGPSPGLPACFMFSASEIVEQLIGDLDWEPLGPFDSQVSEATLRTEDFQARVVEEMDASAALHGGLYLYKLRCERYPQIVLRVGDHLFTSFHLALRKAG